MTFYEAALHILSQHNRALHYKKLTEIAIREQLLSHVGKTPDITMRTRLNLEVKKAEGAEVKRDRPGVFSLSDAYEPREFVKPKPSTPNPVPDQSRDRRRNDRRRNDRRRNRNDEDNTTSDQNTQKADSAENTSDNKPERSNDRRERRGRRGERGGRRRNRRDQQDQSNDQSSDQNNRNSDQSNDRNNDRSNDRNSRNSDRGNTRNNNRNNDRNNDRNSDRNSDRNNDRNNRRNGRDQHKNNGAKPDAKKMAYAEDPELFDDESYNSPQNTPTPRRSRRRNTRTNKAVEPFALDGIAQAAYTVLNDSKRDSMGLDQLSNEIFERKLVRFHTHNASLTVQSALLNDNQNRKAQGSRPIFIDHGNNRWSLSDQGMSDASLQLEKDILEMTDQCKNETAQTLSETLSNIPTESLEQIILTLLERVGYDQIKISKRGGNNDVFFSAALNKGLSQTRVCVQVVGQADRKLEQDDITQLRGTLHHYGATEAVIVHLGPISEGARQEVQEEKLAAVTIIQRDDIVRQMIQQGLGVRTYHAPITLIDNAYIQALQSD